MTWHVNKEGHCFRMLSLTLEHRSLRFFSLPPSAPTPTYLAVLVAQVWLSVQASVARREIVVPSAACILVATLVAPRVVEVVGVCQKRVWECLIWQNSVIRRLGPTHCTHIRPPFTPAFREADDSKRSVGVGGSGNATPIPAPFCYHCRHFTPIAHVCERVALDLNIV